MKTDKIETMTEFSVDEGRGHETGVTNVLFLLCVDSCTSHCEMRKNFFEKFCDLKEP
jgi:hypothetical protein